MNCKILLTLFLAWTGTAAVADAQGAPPPVGVWRGNFSDGSGSVNLSVSGDGAFAIHITGGNPIVGTWSWNPTSSGGIITLNHINGGRPSRLYYSVTWINSRAINFSDPWFRIVLNKS
jgi:hypothetical protein